MPSLRSDGLPVELAPGVTISTPGLEGEAVVHDDVGTTRSLAFTAPAFESALAAHGFETLRTIEIDEARETFAPPGVSRTTRYDEDAMVLELPAPNAEYRQVVLMQDEAGVMTWSFAEVPDVAAVAATRGGATETFVLRRYVPPQPPPGTQRGLLGAIGTKVIKALAFPIHEIAGAVATAFAQKWEANNRPYGLRAVTAETYGVERGGTAPDAAAWAAYEGKPSLLLVHGTFSTSPSTYGMLPRAIFDALSAAYEGRVLEFDHPTMTETPRQNADWFLQQIPEHGTFVFDVLTHSRGGLVARTIAEKSADLATPRNVTIRTLVLTAAPDSGTTLSDAKYMGDFIDTYTNLLNFFPDSVPLDVFHCILAAVKEIAAGALDHLCGLQSMTPKGDFQRWLNAGPKGHGRYYAIGSAFSPSDSGLAHWAEKRLMDTIFKEDNDMVVPTGGVYGDNGSGNFPIVTADRLLFGTKDGVWHCNYFVQPRVHAKLTSWLPTP
jgi:hypothetical protein